MTRPCVQRNPLVRAGMTQHARQRAELASDYFLPDERELADLILFGQRFARHVQYYDGDNQRAGDWCAFFEADATASLAALSRLPVDLWRTTQQDLENWLKADPARDDLQLASHMRLAMRLPVLLLQLAGQQHARLPLDHPFRASLLAMASRDLATPLAGLIGWYRGAGDAALTHKVFDDLALDPADYNLDGDPADSGLHLPSAIGAQLSGQPELELAPVPPQLIAGLAPDGWSSLYLATAADPSPWQDASQSYEQIYDALSYNLLSTAIEHLYQALERMRRAAVSELQLALQGFGNQAAHYGLWLSFLQLFQHARGELNQFTGRHLDFYFRDLLRLGNRAAEPDHVHLLLELARGIDAHPLRAGTLLRAGKDALGLPLSYALDNDILVNRARVSELRAIQQLVTGSAAQPGLLPRAASVVRSLDGEGADKLDPAQPGWPAFGPASSPLARLGFAVADRRLFLREGSRHINLRLQLRDRLPTTSLSPQWLVRLSAAKGWFELRASSRVVTKFDNHFSDEPDERRQIPRPGQSEERSKPDEKRRKPEFPVIEISIELQPDDPAIIPLDAKLHGSEHAAGLPVLELLLDFSSAGSARAWQVIGGVQCEAISLEVSAAGLKDLMVLGGNALVDVAKPFTPFGAQPEAGAQWVIGSAEIFSKPIERCTLDLHWSPAYSSSLYFYKTTADKFDPIEAILIAGEWHTLSSKKARQNGKGRSGRPRVQVSDRTAISLDRTAASVTLRSANRIEGLIEQTLENPPLNAQSRNGFIRLRLPRSFGHQAWQNEQARALVALANQTSWSVPSDVNPDGSLPRRPFTPQISQLSASYTTTRAGVQRFSHLQPFGLQARNPRGRLFPALPFAAALLIGVADFEPPARLTLLVQVLDGSGDPLRSPPALRFEYLAGDRWYELPAQAVDDRTGNFSSSAVLALDIPAAADREHRVMPSGLHWLRLSVQQDAAAMNQLLSIDAQAVRASFVDAGNDPQRLATPLPAGSISRLQVPDLAVKKISQPWSAFGGRPRESDSGFATRVSERLRHKDRAISLWDYEALVLEAFPQLYRVKCLNTTELRRDAQNRVIGDNEQMPGAVTVVTVPWTHGHNSRNPLRPWTDQATLAAVDAFLRQRVSPFVRLAVQNPKFEEVSCDFAVKFRPGVGDIAFAIEQLNQALTRFLTPWSQPGGGEITFGGRLWKSTLIDFVEEQPLVDYVTAFRMYHRIEIDGAAGSWTPVDVELIETTTARSILVSAARHAIREVPGHA